MAEPARSSLPTTSDESASGARARRSPRRLAGRVRLNLLLDSVSGPVPALFAAWLAGLVLTSVQSPMLAVLIVIGFVGAFIAGLVGLGGAIVLIPMLIYGPELVGQPSLDIHAAAGVTMVQVAVAGTAGMLAHRRVGNLDWSVITTLGGSMAAGALVGGLTSGLLRDEQLSAIFAALAAVAATLMLAGHRTMVAEVKPGPIDYNHVAAVTMGLAVGVFVGMVGTGGGFLIIPIMVFVLGIPVRVAVGSTLAIVAAAGISGGIGKAVTGQIDWMMALALVVGALPGAHAGARLSRRIPVGLLARLLGGLIAAIAIKMWWDLLAGG